MYDDLFNKFGKIVFKRTDQKPLSAEVDDDAESLSCKIIFNQIESKIPSSVSDDIMSTKLSLIKGLIIRCC